MDYGNLPQNRERIYIVGFSDYDQFMTFKFPDKVKLTKNISDCLEDREVESKYYYDDKPMFDILKKEIVHRDTIYQWRRKYVRENKSKVCPTLTANMGTGGHNVPLILDKKSIRKLTQRECANFQGFPEDYKIPELADSHLYKQFGNSVSIPVIERIAKEMQRVFD
jgi:DNA (cytosine-5)-methyltransferase 1